LKAWRVGQPEAAAQRFARAAADGRVREDWAGAAFWAARASLRAGKPRQVSRFLRQAAGGDDQFYALLAQRMLDESIDVDWQEERLESATLELLLRYPSVQRAVALGQVGERDLADAELQRVAARAQPELAESLTALAVSLHLPSVQVRLAKELSRMDGRRSAVARYPLPRWQPAGGYRLEPTLVHAIIRAESGFDPTARSPKGAIGLMQVMPDTARLVAKGMKIAYRGERWLMHPPTNMKIGQAWLRRLAGTKTIDGSLIHLIAAYNAGEGRVIDWAKGPLRHAADDPLLYIESVPLAETCAYIKRVLANLWAYQARQGQKIGSLRALAQNRWPEVELGKEAVAVAMKPTRHARAN
jgi:soluble lytic murein transglycosylase-like protein